MQFGVMSIPTLAAMQFGVMSIPTLVAMQFGVMSIPTLVVMKNGKIVNQVTGARPKAQILAML